MLAATPIANIIHTHAAGSYISSTEPATTIDGIAEESREEAAFYNCRNVMDRASKNAESTEEKHRNYVEHFAAISFGDWGENDAAQDLDIEVSVESYEKACI